MDRLAKRKATKHEKIKVNNLELFNEYGFVVLENAIEEELLDRYLASWDADNATKFDEHGNNFGWSNEHEYLDHPEIMDIICHTTLSKFFTDLKLAVALHRVDTWATSSEKPWHQDSTFTNPNAYNNYIGAWVAAEDVHEQAGPFQLIPKSHRWEFDKHSVYFGENNGEIIDGRWVNTYLQQEIESHSDQEPFTFLGKKGDVLIWHGNLLHRALIPTDKKIMRRAVIGHYTNTFHCEEAKEEDYLNALLALLANPRTKQWKKDCYYFDLR